MTSPVALARPRNIGILGAGQLGCLLGRALQKLGATPLFYDENPSAPGLAQFPEGTVGGWTDETKLRAFLARCERLTFEFENVALHVVERVARERGVEALPGFQVMRTSQHRLLEKRFLAGQGFPVAAFAEAHEAWDLGFPLIVKTATLGYDGKGQWRVNDKEQLEALLATHGDVELVAEEPIALCSEASVIVCRDALGEAIAFPPFENLHEDHILAYTVLPARVSPAVAQALRRVALEVAESLNLRGILTVEFFLSRENGRRRTGAEVDGTFLFVNELAPRPHNSGHITLNACSLSQFDAAARVLCDLDLAEPRLRAGGWCMGNLLGNLWRAPEAPLDLSALASHREVCDLVLYGKREARKGRKMGHFSVESSGADSALASARSFKAAIMAANHGS